MPSASAAICRSSSMPRATRDAAISAIVDGAYEQQLNRFWIPVLPRPRGLPVRGDAVGRLVISGKLDVASARSASRCRFLPPMRYVLLQSGLSGQRACRCPIPLERLRARKIGRTNSTCLREASERSSPRCWQYSSACRPGMTKHEIVAALRARKSSRGLTFEYCLITAGTSSTGRHRTSSWHEGEIMSLDSGGNYHGYIGDLCRMGILGEPTPSLRTCSARSKRFNRRRGSRFAPGHSAATSMRRRSRPRAARRNYTHFDFVAHGMGLVSHEAPRLTGTGPVPYPGNDADRPLESRHGHLDRDDAAASASAASSSSRIRSRSRRADGKGSAIIAVAGTKGNHRLACQGHRYSSVTCPNRRSRCLSLNLPTSKSVARLNATEPAWPNTFQSPCARCIAAAGLGQTMGSPATIPPPSAKSKGSATKRVISAIRPHFVVYLSRTPGGMPQSARSTKVPCLLHVGHVFGTAV